MIKKALFIFVVAIASVWILPTSQAHAASFNKNRLIDDSLFTDVDSMTVAEIQSFLESQGSLLANWVDNVNMRRPSDNCVVHYATGMTAAEIIYEAATNWGAQVYDSNGCAIQGAYWSDPGYSNYTLDTVSPKVLLVTLQKEQSLLSANGGYSTDPNAYKNPACCSSNEYKLARAMGYGVPDSGGINEKYLGFYNQINWAAWQLRFNFERSAGNTAWDEVSYLTYAGPMIEGSFRRCGTCSLLAFDGYYPIDGSPLYMDNRATAALYYYTPHTYPGYFGNYNFVQFYSAWFGSVFADAFAYSYHSQSSHPAMVQGYGNNLTLRFKNTGSEDWYDTSGLASAPIGTKPVLLAPDKPYNNTSSPFRKGWSDWNSPATEYFKVYEADALTLSADQDKVSPGQVVEFRVNLKSFSNTTPGSYQQFFTLSREGTGGSRLNGQLVWSWPKVIEAKYIPTYAGQRAAKAISGEETTTVYFRYRNSGNVDWYDYSGRPDSDITPLTLATFGPINRASNLSRTWPGANRPAGLNFSRVYESDGVTLASKQHKASPGQIVEWRFDFAGNKRATDKVYREEFKLIREGWSQPLVGPTTWLYVDYDPGNYSAGWHGQTPHPTIAKGDTQTFTIRFKNNGDVTWYDKTSAPKGIAPIAIATTNSLNRSSSFASAWPTKNRPALTFDSVYESDGVTLAANQDRVEPGQIGRFTFDYTVPTNQASGTYREDFILIRSGASEYNFDNNTRFWSYISVP